MILSAYPALKGALPSLSNMVNLEVAILVAAVVIRGNYGKQEDYGFGLG